ncbi:hypothetical protein PIB30_038821 [Stylosanthes scabra]|uniref:Transmembrane protein n=1 Tax=Stylosanthes scabra TaxID=79078 RepID=A0ABU6SFE2_9FABA|nr:hypothetical protein [Stylosanthes scabra]
MAFFGVGVAGGSGRGAPLTDGMVTVGWSTAAAGKFLNGAAMRRERRCCVFNTSSVTTRVSHELLVQTPFQQMGLSYVLQAQLLFIYFTSNLRSPPSSSLLSTPTPTAVVRQPQPPSPLRQPATPFCRLSLFLTSSPQPPSAASPSSLQILRPSSPLRGSVGTPKVSIGVFPFVLLLPPSVVVRRSQALVLLLPPLLPQSFVAGRSLRRCSVTLVPVRCCFAAAVTQIPTACTGLLFLAADSTLTLLQLHCCGKVKAWIAIRAAALTDLILLLLRCCVVAAVVFVSSLSATAVTGLSCLRCIVGLLLLWRLKVNENLNASNN